MTRTIYKILPLALWRQAKALGEFRGAPVDEADGYIHFSGPDQVRETAAKHFAGKADLVLLAVDADRLGSDLKWEPSRGGALFPHLYAPMPIEAVVAEHPLPLGEDGRHRFPEKAA